MNLRISQQTMKRRHAAAIGVTSYVTGKPCSKGHYSERRTTDGACRACERLGRRTSARKRYERKRKGTPVIAFLIRARRRSRAMGLSCDITRADLEPLPQACPLLGVPLFYGSGKGGQPKQNSASLDRIDSTKGYVKGNVWIISLRANTIKSSATLEEFERIAAAWRLWL